MRSSLISTRARMSVASARPPRGRGLSFRALPLALSPYEFTMTEHGCRYQAFVAALLLVAGCAGGQHPAASAVGTAWHELHFKGAALPSRRASGAPWHAGAEDASSVLLGGLIGLAVGYPEAGFALGSALVSVPEPEAPAPYVVVKVAGDTYKISPIGRTLAPHWAQPIAIPAGLYPPRTPALVQVLDAVDHGILGQRETTIGELLAPGARTLTEIGEVASLDLEVRAMAPRPDVTVELFVNGERNLDQLERGDDRRWTAVPIWNGDTITVRAVGQVCPSDPNECFGPEGAGPGRWRSYNYDVFADAPHASLVALLPGQAVPIGQGATFVAEQSGFLLLFVNDTDEDNNTGGYDVRVDVAAR